MSSTGPPDPGPRDTRPPDPGLDGGPQLPWTALLVVVYAGLAGGLYVLLGVVAGAAQGLTPIVLLVAAALFGLAVLTHVEGASLHPERAGSPAFARRGFDELVSFVAAWLLVLDYLLLLAAAALAFTSYAAAFWAPLDDGATRFAVAAGLLAFVAFRGVRGYGRRRAVLVGALTAVDVLLQAVLVVLGLALLATPAGLADVVSTSDAAPLRDALFALGVALVVITGLESSSGLAGEVRIGRRGLARVAGALPLSMLLLWPTTAIVGLIVLPASAPGGTALGGAYLDAPVLGIATGLAEVALGDVLVLVVGALGALTLVAFAGSAMLGLARTTARMARHRQLPARVARLDARSGTPRATIVAAALVAFALVLPRDLPLLAGAMAFGVLAATTIAHLAVLRLRWIEPRQDRPFRMRPNLPVGPGGLPVPALFGAVLSAAAWASIVVLHPSARWIGLGWLVAGLVAYVAYRRSRGLPVRGQVVVPDSALHGRRPPRELGSILVPILGTAIDDDLVQTAGRLAGGDDETDLEGEEAVIEAVWVHVVPIARALDGPLAAGAADAARTALARARDVGEEYEGVRVATSAVRARSAGRAIVEQAARRGVEQVVMAADASPAVGATRARTRLGVRGGRGHVVSSVTRYVLEHAPCPVVLTAPGPDEVLRRARPATAEPDAVGADEDEDERWLESL